MELLLNDIHSIFKPLIAFPAFLLLLLFIGLLFYHYLIGKFLAWITLVAFYVLSIPATSQWLAKPLETIPPIKPEQLVGQKVEAILILGGGRSGYSTAFADNPLLGGSSVQRLVYAAHLHRSTGLPLICTGGPVGDDDEQGSAILSAAWLKNNMQIEPVLLETRSKTTWQNAEFSKSLMDEHGIKKVAVVTHAAHMPRAMHAMQIHAIDAVAAPFGYITKVPDPDGGIHWSDWQPKGLAIRHNVALLHEHIGALWYDIKAQAL